MSPGLQTQSGLDNVRNELESINQLKQEWVDYLGEDEFVEGPV